MDDADEGRIVLIVPVDEHSVAVADRAQARVQGRVGQRPLVDLTALRMRTNTTLNAGSSSLGFMVAAAGLQIDGLIKHPFPLHGCVTMHFNLRCGSKTHTARLQPYLELHLNTCRLGPTRSWNALCTQSCRSAKDSYAAMRHCEQVLDQLRCVNTFGGFPSTP